MIYKSTVILNKFEILNYWSQAENARWIAQDVNPYVRSMRHISLRNWMSHNHESTQHDIVFYAGQNKKTGQKLIVYSSLQ